jgi:hypothetical protein
MGVYPTGNSKTQRNAAVGAVEISLMAHLCLERQEESVLCSVTLPLCVTIVFHVSR